MKKLILSAVFALACFTAQAKNEIIKNDDDKKPKAKTETKKVEEKAPQANCSGTVSITCRRRTYVADITWNSGDASCAETAGAAAQSVADIVCK